MNQYIPEMLLALEANIEYLRQEGDSQIRIKNGQLNNVIDGVYIYEFELDFLQNIESDTEIELRIAGDWASGKVIAISEKRIQIEVDKSFGKIIPAALLIISSYYLLQLLHDKLVQIQNGMLSLTDLSEKTFALKPAVINHADYRIPASQSNLPNEFQENAIKLALGSEVSFIWGPPGTGKTRTIARIIEGYVLQQKSVLLIAHTNIATDGALLSTVEHLERQSDDYANGKILRIGNIQNEELKKFHPLVIPENVIATQSESIRGELVELITKIVQLQKRLAPIDEHLAEFVSVENMQREVQNLDEYLNDQHNSIGRINDKLSEAQIEYAKVNEKIDKYNSTGRFLRLFSWINYDKVVTQKTECSIKIKEYGQSLLSFKARIDEAEQKITELRSKLAKSTKRLVGFSRDELLVKKSTIENQISSFEKEQSVIQKQLDELSVNVIREARIIATTLTKSYSSKEVLSREYDCVIIDEASMAPLPAVWCATGLAKQNVVIVGDFLQLPPIVKHKVLKTKSKTQQDIEREEELIKKWLKQDIFNVANITASIDRGIQPAWLEELRIQYRMHPEIGELVNYLIYREKGEQFELRHDESTKDKGSALLHSEPLKDFHIGIYDTSNISPIPTRTDSGSQYNFYHAILCMKLAEQAIHSGYSEVGIISPFRAQTNLIQKMVIDLSLEQNIKADTVHRFQGGERQIIIFDVSTPMPTMLLDDQSAGGDDEKLINVAFSRAEEKCLVVADVSKILKRHSQTSLIRKFINYCTENGKPIIQTDNILNQFNVSDKAEKWLKKVYNIEKLTDDIDNSELFDQTDFYKYFVQDILAAQKEIIIDSPFITIERTNFFLPILQYLLNKNINIFIITRQPKENDEILKFQSKKVIEQLEEMGIVVLPFRGHHHRKLAIIDRNILWEGSLNILSQRESQEIMRRFVGADTSKQMMMFLKLDKNIGAIGENKLQRCPYCKKPGSWFWTDKSIFGQWTYCLVGGHASNKLPKTKEEVKEGKEKLRKSRKAIKDRTDSGIPICKGMPDRPHEPLQMVRREGPFGQFWGCPKYPRCRVTEK
jgi:superfamily I DNA and/or RNA helicase